MNNRDNELAELQATIDTLTQDFKELGERYSKLQTGEDSMLHRVIAERDAYKAEIERLKGGQGEPVAFRFVWPCGNLGNWYSASPEAIAHALEDVKRGVWKRIDFAYTSQPAPVSVRLPERIEPPSDYAYRKGWNACLDKVKEMNYQGHASDCSTNNRGVPELLGPCDCHLSKKSP